MAAPLLIGLGKALLSQAPKIAAKQLGKKAVKNAAKDFVKGKVKDKLKGKKKKKGGALVRSEDITSTGEQVNETAQKISPQKLLPSSVDTTTSSAVISPSGKTSYEKISQRLDNIIGITGALDKAFKQQLKDKKKTAKATQNARQTERKKAREEKLEQGKKSLGIGAAAMSAAKKFGLMDFITNVLLGGLILFLLKQAPKIEKIFNFLTENLYASFLIIRGVLQAFKGAFKQFGKIVRGILKTGVRIATKPFRMAGSAIASGFRRLGNAIFNFARMGLNFIRRGLGLRPFPKSPGKGGGKSPDKGGGKGKTKATPTGSGAGKASRPAGFMPRSDARGNQVAGKGRQYRSNLQRIVRPGQTPQGLRMGPKPGSLQSRLAGLKANLQTGTAFGGRGANLQRGSYGAVVKGNNFLRKLFNIVNPKEIQALADASPALKKAGNFMKGARIPVVGPLIVFTVNALDPTTQSLGQAAFKAIGAGLGEFLGFAIPIPILGPIIGGLVGEVMGDVAYEIIVNNNPAEAGKKIMNAVESVGDIGGKILDWAKGFVGRFFDALPKIKMPSVKVFGKETIPFGGTEIIDPTAILGPRALIETPKAFLTALFQPEKKEKGEVKEDKTQNQTAQPQTSVIPSSTSPMSMSIGNVSGGNSDFWTLVAVASREDSDGQARADVAQSIYNRVASGAYGSGTIRDFILRDKQYQPTWDYPKKNSSMKANPEWHQITDAQSAATAAGTSVAFIQQAAADITNKKYQEEARNFVGGRTDFTNYSKSSRKGQVVRTSNAPNNYFGWDWNYSDNTMGAIPNFNTTSSPSQQSQQQNPPAQPAQQQPTQNTPVQPAPAQQQQTATPVQPSSSTASQNASQVSRSASYEDGAEQTIIIPSPSQQQQQPMMTPQQSGSVIRVGGSTKDVLNSYYKAQLLGFLYKQG